MKARIFAKMRSGRRVVLGDEPQRTGQHLGAEGAPPWREPIEEEGLGHVFASRQLPWSVVRRGSILWLALQDGDPPISAEAIDPDAATRYAVLHSLLLERGVYLAPSAYEVMFVSTAHDDAVIDDTIAAFDDALSEISG